MQSAKIVSFPQKEQISKHNLPAQPTPLIGRERDVASVAHLLRDTDVRLLTLTGTAGVGKTRLALQVAVDTIDDFTDGIYFVPLASISDPGLVVPAITQTLGLGETANLPLLDLLNAYLQHKHLLLLLDNFEQIVIAAPLLAQLLETCPEVKMMATSREMLHLRAEHQYSVPPLALPDLKQLPGMEALPQCAAVELFLRRAQAVKPDFQMSAADARAIAEICVRLEGLPLAIELAAARISVLSPQSLLARLGHRFQILTQGPQDVHKRQQTLHNAIQWSYDLLSAEEQQLFRRLSAFVGGCTLESIEAVCAALGDRAEPALNSVASLIGKSLLYRTEQEGNEPRLLMLETIREYGLEALAASGEMDVTQHAHAQYYLALAEEAESKLVSAEQLAWLDRLEREHTNLRAAMRWLLEQAGHAGTGGVEQSIGDGKEMALRLAGALWFFWPIRGHFSEGRIFLEYALAAGEGVATTVRAKALYGAMALAFLQGDYSHAEVCGEESLKLHRELAVQYPQEATFKLGLAAMLHGLGYLALLKGDYATVHALCEESLPLLKQVGDRWRIPEALLLLAHACDGRGDYAGARAMCEESLVLSREIGECSGMAQILLSLGYFAYRQHDYAAARLHYEESLAVSQELGAQWLTASCLLGLGEVALAQGQPTWAPRLWGAAEGLRETLDLARRENFGLVLQLSVERADYKEAVASARAQLGEEAFAAAWAEGRMMTAEQALVAQGPAAVPQPTATAPRPPAYSAGLTVREVEVLQLVAQGLTNIQIAQQLILSEKTVTNHLTHIFNKTTTENRAAATAFAIRHGLA
jgi:predicted ATPase/DNA-binding CsgD family transcriptional regulator